MSEIDHEKKPEELDDSLTLDKEDIGRDTVTGDTVPEESGSEDVFPEGTELPLQETTDTEEDDLILLEESDKETQEMHQESEAAPGDKKKHSRKARKKSREDSITDDLEFITHDSVRDKSKMAEGEEIKGELISRKKTKRRSVDAEEAKLEKAQKIARKHFPLIIAGIAAIIVVLCLLGFGVRHYLERKAEENKEQPLSAQEYEKNGNEEIKQLITDYYACYADGDVEKILQYAQPMSDSEKSYIQMYSEFVDEYQNIVCYTKTGEDTTTYIVSVSFNVKYKDVDTAAPGMDFFYVRTGENGNYYIDNTYSPFNLLYQEYTLDQNIVQLIQTYETGEDVILLQAGVQTNYEQVLEQDPALKTMVEETITNAVSAWQTEHEAAIQQKAQEAQQQVQQEQTAQEQEAQQQQQAEAYAETENKAWVYVNDTVNIRQEPNESSAVLASAGKGSEIRQLATTNNGWCKVKTGEIVGYIKAEYISAEAVGGGAGSSISDGQTIELTSSVNIRSAMSETSDRVGLAYAGETVTVVQSYSEGWCKVNWNGQIGYIRSDILAQQ